MTPRGKVVSLQTTLCIVSIFPPALPPLGSGFPVPASLHVAALPVPDSVGRAMFSQRLRSEAQHQSSGAGVGPTPFLIQSLWPRDKAP